MLSDYIGLLLFMTESNLQKKIIGSYALKRREGRGEGRKWKHLSLNGN